MTAEDKSDKKREHKNPQPIVPKDREEALRMLCDAAAAGNIEEINRLALWKPPPSWVSKLLNFIQPPLVSGDMSNNVSVDEGSDKNFSNKVIYWSKFPHDKTGYGLPLVFALYAPNAAAFKLLLSYNPKYFLDRHLLKLVRGIIWQCRWSLQEKLIALQLLMDNRVFLKDKNGVPIKKEDLANFLESFPSQPAVPESNRDTLKRLCHAAEKGDSKEIDRLVAKASSHNPSEAVNSALSYSHFSEASPLFSALEAPNADAFNALLDAKALQPFNKSF